MLNKKINRNDTFIQCRARRKNHAAANCVISIIIYYILILAESEISLFYPRYFPEKETEKPANDRGEDKGNHY